VNNKEGGYAFPRQLKQVENSIEFERSELAAQTGMTMRDYFAAKAMASVAVEWMKAYTDAERTGWIHKACDEQGVDSTDLITDLCYELADEMLKARELE